MQLGHGFYVLKDLFDGNARQEWETLEASTLFLLQHDRYNRPFAL